MAKTSIIINSTDTAGKAAQKTFTDVNPNASNAQLATLGQMLAAVSTNTYNGTTRIDKTDCDTESKTARSVSTITIASDVTLEPPFTGDVDVSKLGTSNTGYSFEVRFREEAYAANIPSYPTLTNVVSADYQNVMFASFSRTFTAPAVTSGVGYWRFHIWLQALNQDKSGTLQFTIHFPATDTYAALDVPITLHFTNQEG